MKPGMAFHLYKSSAGSGKTYTLVRELIRLLIINPGSYKNILAITFTNKAAKEMKQRVVKGLDHLSRQQENPDSLYNAAMLPELEETTGYGRDEIADRALKALRGILHNYSDFSISTIDSFTHHIIRSFAFDLRIPGNFSVELDVEDVLRRIIDILIDKAGTDPDITALLVNFIHFRIDDDKYWNIEDDIAGVAKAIFREDSLESLALLRKLEVKDFMKVISGLSKYLAELEDAISGHAEKALRTIHDAGLDITDFYQGPRGIGNYFGRIAQKDYSGLSPNSYVRSAIEEDVWYTGKKPAAIQSAIDQIKPALIEAYQGIRESAMPYITAMLVRKTVFPVALLNEINILLEDYKKKNQILFISEFNQRISEVVLNEPMPFIYERAGQRYRHVMVDEFQDTSVKQWENILPLYENALGEDSFCMIVGDAKQAIYRWRNGDVDQFIRLADPEAVPADPLTAERESSLKRSLDVRDLSMNWRSRENIIRFNNAFFTAIAGLLPEWQRKIYGDCAQKPGKEQPGGYVRLEFFSGSSRERGDGYLERVEGIIRDCIEAGYSYRDIAILCRNNANGAMTAATLLEKSIPVISSESLLLGMAPQVRCLVSAMKLLHDPGDLLSMIHIAGFLSTGGIISGTAEELLGEIAPTKKKVIGPGRFADWLKRFGLEFRYGYLKSLSLYDAAEELVRTFRLLDPPDPFIQYFLDAVTEYSEKNHSGIMDFLEWWEETGSRKSIVLPDEMDAVRILTIHKAKGLEFPVVIYPFAEESLRRLTREEQWTKVNMPGMGSFTRTLLKYDKSMLDTGMSEQYLEEYEKSLFDLVNLMYVCFTRPTDRLYILTSAPPKKTDEVKSVPGFLRYFLSQRNEWQSGVTDYEFGAAGYKEDVSAGSGHKFSIGKWRSSAWQERLAIHLRAPAHWDFESGSAYPAWGKLIHSILAGSHSANDAEKIIDRLYRDAVITGEERKRLAQTVTSFMEHSGVKTFFEKEATAMTEKEIITPDGISYRPDRILIEGNRATVIDFKAGMRRPEHRDQIEQYARLLADMGYAPVRKYLLYVYEKDPVCEI